MRFLLGKVLLAFTFSTVGLGNPASVPAAIGNAGIEEAIISHKNIPELYAQDTGEAPEAFEYLSNEQRLEWLRNFLSSEHSALAQALLSKISGALGSAKAGLSPTAIRARLDNAIAGIRANVDLSKWNSIFRNASPSDQASPVFQVRRSLVGLASTLPFTRDSMLAFLPRAEKGEFQYQELNHFFSIFEKLSRHINRNVFGNLETCVQGNEHSQKYSTNSLKALFHMVSAADGTTSQRSNPIQNSIKALQSIIQRSSTINLESKAKSFVRVCRGLNAPTTSGSGQCPAVLNFHQEACDALQPSY